MRLSVKIFFVSFALCLCTILKAGTGDNDVFIPISKYLGKGDADKLSAWFADNLEVSVLSETNDCSKNQARQILKVFFENHKPQSFTIDHTVSRVNSKYALGNLFTGGDTFLVTIFVSGSKGNYKIQQLLINRIR